MQRIKMQMTLPIKIVKKEKWYVSSCPVLDVFSQGDSHQEAKMNIIEALSLFLITCYDHGTLESVLRQCGFKKADSGCVDVDDAEYVDVPLYLSSNEEQLCHA